MNDNLHYLFQLANFVSFYWNENTLQLWKKETGSKEIFLYDDFTFLSDVISSLKKEEKKVSIIGNDMIQFCELLSVSEKVECLSYSPIAPLKNFFNFSDKASFINMNGYTCDICILFLYNIIDAKSRCCVIHNYLLKFKENKIPNVILCSSCSDIYEVFNFIDYNYHLKTCQQKYSFISNDMYYYVLYFSENEPCDDYKIDTDIEHGLSNNSKTINDNIQLENLNDRKLTNDNEYKVIKNNEIESKEFHGLEKNEHYRNGNENNLNINENDLNKKLFVNENGLNGNLNLNENGLNGNLNVNENDLKGNENKLTENLTEFMNNNVQTNAVITENMDSITQKITVIRKGQSFINIEKTNTVKKMVDKNRGCMEDDNKENDIEMVNKTNQNSKCSEHLYQKNNSFATIVKKLNISKEMDINGLQNTKKDIFNEIYYTPHRDQDKRFESINLRTFKLKDPYGYPVISDIIHALYDDNLIVYNKTEYAIKFGIRVQMTISEIAEIKKYHISNDKKNLEKLFKRRFHGISEEFLKKIGQPYYCNLNFSSDNDIYYNSDTFDDFFYMIRIFRKK